MSSTTSASRASGSDGLQIYVGILAATILFIATNAGVIGASRITYSMATYRQLPEIFRRLHPRFKTPWLSLVLFAGIAPIAVILPGDVTFVGTLYSFGDAFAEQRTRAIRLRMTAHEGRRIAPAEPALARRRLACSSRSSAGWRPAFSFGVILVQNAPTRWVGLGWLAAGLIGYVVYRRRVLHEPLTETVRAPAAFGPALALEYRRLLVPVAGSASDEALDVACSLAAERGAAITAVSVIEVPLELPISETLEEDERAPTASSPRRA